MGHDADGPAVETREGADDVLRPAFVYLKQLAAVIGRSCLFFGVDSAPMHIAAAVGTPVVALFGPSGEHNWGPWGAGHRVVAVNLFCRPCGQDGCNGSKRSDCLELLTEAEVIAAVDAQLARGGLAPEPAEVGARSGGRGEASAGAGVAAP